MKLSSTVGESDPVGRLRRDLHLRRLSRAWAKLEILLGLGAAGCGLMLGQHLAVADFDAAGYAAALSLFTLGGYLALAGHRSHLYQSNNELTAHLAEEIRRADGRGPTS